VTRDRNRKRQAQTCRYCGHEFDAEERRRQHCNDCGISVETASKWIYRREEVREFLGLLGAFGIPPEEWEFTKANKDHVDAFGQPIADGEIYFKRQFGMGWQQNVKVSMLSMQGLLHVLFGTNSWGRVVATRLKEMDPSWFEGAHESYVKRGGDRQFLAFGGREAPPLGE
jgi:hypothetical protein